MNRKQKTFTFFIILLLLAAIVQNAMISSQIGQQSAQIEQLEKQAQKNEKTINKLLTPQQINQLRGERILESLYDTTSKNKSIKMEVDDVR